MNFIFIRNTITPEMDNTVLTPNINHGYRITHNNTMLEIFNNHGRLEIYDYSNKSSIQIQTNTESEASYLNNISNLNIIYFNNKYKILYSIWYSIIIIDLDDLLISNPLKPNKKIIIFDDDINFEYRISHNRAIHGVYVMINNVINIVFEYAYTERTTRYYRFYYWQSSNINKKRLIYEYEQTSWNPNKIQFIQSNNSIALINISPCENLNLSKVPFLITSVNLSNFKEIHQQYVPERNTPIYKCLITQSSIVFMTPEIIYVYNPTGGLIHKFTRSSEQNVYSIRNRYIILYDVCKYCSVIYDLLDPNTPININGFVSDINQEKIVSVIKADDPFYKTCRGYDAINTHIMVYDFHGRIITKDKLRNYDFCVCGIYENGQVYISEVQYPIM